MYRIVARIPNGENIDFGKNGDDFKGNIIIPHDPEFLKKLQKSEEGIAIQFSDSDMPGEAFITLTPYEYSFVDAQGPNSLSFYADQETLTNLRDEIEAVIKIMQQF